MDQMDWDETIEMEVLQKIEEHKRKEKERLISEFDRVTKIREDLRKNHTPSEVITYLRNLNLSTGEKSFPKGGVWKSKLRGLRGLKNSKNFLDIAMDYMENARREEEAPLIREEFLKRSIEEQVLHKYKQKEEVELSMLRHPEDLQTKNRLSRMLDNATIFKNRIDSKRADEHDRLMRERAVEVVEIRNQERDTRRKMLFYLKTEEEKLLKLQEAERKKMKKKTKLDKIAERQRQLELEEKVARQKVIDLWSLSSTIIKPSIAADFLPPEPFSESKLIFV